MERCREKSAGKMGQGSRFAGFLGAPEEAGKKKIGGWGPRLCSRLYRGDRKASAARLGEVENQCAGGGLASSGAHLTRGGYTPAQNNGKDKKKQRFEDSRRGERHDFEKTTCTHRLAGRQRKKVDTGG